MKYIYLAIFFISSQINLAFANTNLSDSVVMIRSVNQGYNHTTPWKQEIMSQGVGTGFIISGNKILTNAHNIGNTKYVEVTLQRYAKRYPAKVVFAGHDCDLAIVEPIDKTFFNETSPLEIGQIPEINSKVSTYGFPVGGKLISVTEGVVSRIQMDTYSHPGADSHLVIQTDAAINPGNSGGPVIQNNKVVGVAFQGLRQADNIGYLIPTTVINHFLDDIKDNTYDGFGSLGFSYYPGLHSPSYKSFLKVPNEQQGVVVLNTQINTPAYNLLQPGDVLTQFDDYDIDNDGMIQIYGLRIGMSQVIEEKQIGENLNITFYRNGKKHQENAKILLNRPVIEYSRQYDSQPEYVVFAGLTFIKLSRDYLETWGRNWSSTMPHILKYLFQNASSINDESDRKCYAVLSEILPDQVNTYAKPFHNMPLESINNIEILDLNNIPEALEHPIDGNHIFKFIGHTIPLVINAKIATERHPIINNNYQIKNDSYLK